MNRESTFGMPSQRYGRETICGNCIHHQRMEGYDRGWICENDISDFYLDETDYNFGCVDFESKKGKN